MSKKIPEKRKARTPAQQQPAKEEGPADLEERRKTAKKYYNRMYMRKVRLARKKTETLMMPSKRELLAHLAVLANKVTDLEAQLNPMAGTQP